MVIEEEKSESFTSNGHVLREIFERQNRKFAGQKWVKSEFFRKFRFFSSRRKYVLVNFFPYRGYCKSSLSNETKPKLSSYSLVEKFTRYLRGTKNNKVSKNGKISESRRIHLYFCKKLVSYSDSQNFFLQEKCLSLRNKVRFIEKIRTLSRGLVPVFQLFYLWKRISREQN